MNATTTITSSTESPTEAFQSLIDGEWVKAAFQDKLPGFSQGNLRITQCDVLRAQSKTYLDDETREKSYFYACYRLEVMDMGNHQRGEQLLYAQVFLNNRSQRKFQNYAHHPLAMPRFGEPLVHLADLDMIVWAFPNDPRLPHLPAVTDPQTVTQHLPYAQLPAELSGPEDVISVAVNVIRYKPEKRCTIRCDVYWGAASAPSQLTIFGKAAKGDLGAEVYRRMVALWRSSSENPHAFQVARPLGYSENVNTVWQAALPGVPLLDLINETNVGQYTPHLEAVARGLACLHQSDLAPRARRTIDGHLASVREEVSKLVAAFPHFSERLQALTTRIEQSAPDPVEVPTKLIHRDFHIKQLLVHEGRLFIFDYDDFSLGDPLEDLAFFMVDLHYRSINKDLMGSIIEAFLQAYQSQVDWDVPVARLNWHVRIQFLAKAYWLYKKKQLWPNLETDIQRTIVLAVQGIEMKEYA